VPLTAGGPGVASSFCCRYSKRIDHIADLNSDATRLVAVIQDGNSSALADKAVAIPRYGRICRLQALWEMSAALYGGNRRARYA
jgi:hypothetical protein